MMNNQKPIGDFFQIENGKLVFHINDLESFLDKSKNNDLSLSGKDGQNKKPKFSHVDVQGIRPHIPPDWI